MEEKNKKPWAVGNKVDSIAGSERDGEVIEIVSNNGVAVLKIKWPDGREETRLDRTLKRK